MNPEWGETLKRSWDGKDVWKTAQDLVDENANIVTELR
jgi:hypothetical protein